MTLRDYFLAFIIVGSIITTAVTFFYKARIKRNEYKPSGWRKELIEVSHQTWYIFLFFTILYLFIAEKFVVPSGSMKPTLVEGDLIIVDKNEYGIKLPFINYTVFNNKQISRGDIVVFTYPDHEMTYIKRIIGLPGDKIRYKNKMIYINDTPLRQEFVEKSIDKYKDRDLHVRKFIEHIPNREHEIMLYYGINNETSDLVVPEGHYFLMGDNRDNSKDSRYYGFVPEELVIGRATYVIFSFNTDEYSFRSDRFFKALK